MNVSERLGDGSITAEAKEDENHTVSISVQSSTGKGVASMAAAELLAADSADLYRGLQGRVAGRDSWAALGWG